MNNTKQLSFATFSKEKTSASIENAFKPFMTEDAAKKLAPAGFSQRNECVNSMIGSKAPKISQYSGSESSDFRTVAGVAQFNDGFNYVVQAAEQIGVAHNVVAQKYVKNMDNKKERDSRRKSSKDFKKARRNAKRKKSRKTRSLEESEGVTYESGVGLTQSEEDKVANTNGTLDDHRTTIADEEFHRFTIPVSLDKFDQQVITMVVTSFVSQLKSSALSHENNRHSYTFS